MAFQVERVEAFLGNQVILWLADETTGSTRMPNDAGEWCVRLRADQISPFIRDLLDAQAKTLSNILLDVAAGGCRTCGNERRIGINHFAMLTGGDAGGEPCPVCVPRAEERIRKAARLPRRKTHG